MTHIEAVEEYLLKQPEFSSPQFRLVIKVRDFLSPYAMYAFWVASWLAASWAAKLAGRWWEGEYGETMPFEWLWTARLAALAGALIVLVGGGAIIVHWFVPEMVLHWLNPVDEQPPPQPLWNEEKRD